MVRIRYKRDFKALETRRRKGMQMLARGVAQAEVARVLGVSRQTASTWEAMRTQERQAWRRKSLGRPSRLEAPQRARLAKMIVAGAVANGFPTELWTLARVAAVIQRLTGVGYHPGHVWRLLRGLGWSLQRPARRASERDEAEIARWRAQEWPRIKGGR